MPSSRLTTRRPLRTLLPAARVPGRKVATAALVPRPRPAGGGRAIEPGPPADRYFPAALLVHVAARLSGLAVLVLTGLVTDRPALRALERWDAHWYRRIAEHGYGHVRVAPDGRALADYVFFPLYPWTERLVSGLTGLTVMHAGLAISAACSVVAAAGIFVVGSKVVGRRAALVLVALWSVLPIAVVQSMAYSESLFTALTAWTFVALLRDRYLLAGALACLAGLTRPSGAAVVAAVVVAAAVRLRSTPTRPAPERARLCVGAALAPLGTLGFLGYVGWQRGEPAGYLHAASGWGNGIDGGAAFAGWAVALLLSGSVAVGLLLVAAVTLLFWQLCLMVRDRFPLPLVVFSAVSVLLALSTSGYFGSKPRYLLPVFPLLMPAAAWIARLPRPRAAALLAGMAVVSVVYGTSWLLGAGPP